MADNCCKCTSHAGFYVCMALLAIAIAGSGYWWFTTNNIDADRERTAQMNQPSHPPKNVKPRLAADAPAPSASASTQSDGK
jgi:hypothetical protein